MKCFMWMASWPDDSGLEELFRSALNMMYYSILEKPQTSPNPLLQYDLYDLLVASHLRKLLFTLVVQK